MTLIKALAFGALVCLASWAALAIAAGDVGLQHSVSRDPVFFAVTYPLAIALSLAAAFTAAFTFTRIQRTPRAFALLGALAVLLGDVVAGFLVAPVMVGELGIEHGFIVLLAISLYGLQLAAAWLGAFLG
ncbi:MAG: hypothetical protein M3395_11520, partial [Chloroflexota bacterium]|nr:hypothetical protein [Chloroflexota bacterium]